MQRTTPCTLDSLGASSTESDTMICSLLTAYTRSNTSVAALAAVHSTTCHDVAGRQLSASLVLLDLQNHISADNSVCLLPVGRVQFEVRRGYTMQNISRYMKPQYCQGKTHVDHSHNSGRTAG